MDSVKKSIILTPFNILYKINPKLDLEILFRLKQGYKLDLKNPKTYNEKIQWIKLYDKNPLMAKCCDKYAVREYVESKGCGGIQNKLIWQGFDPSEIPFDSLPERFVIKVTHGSTFNIICKDKKSLDREYAVKKCVKWLKHRFIPCYGEWFYGVEKPRVIVEEYLEDENNKNSSLKDYKVYCFNGRPEYIRVMTGRFSDLHDTVYDSEWNLLRDVNMGYPCTNTAEERPKCLDEMLTYAKELSKDFNHARVDFYIVNGRIYFGEITFTSGSGFDKFSSYDFDSEVGKKLRLSIK